MNIIKNIWMSCVLGCIRIGEMTPPGNSFAQQSIELVNGARSGAGLMRLVENKTLTHVAMAYSGRMARENFYGHVDPQGKGVESRIAATGYLAQASAENIARGQPGPATVVEGWLNSPGHRANIMNPTLREIGAGYATTTTPPYFHYWTHVFATPDGSTNRDRSSYPHMLLAEVNRLRQAAGTAPLTPHSTLETIARNQLATLANARTYRGAASRTLNAASRAALQSFSHALALTAAGAATPEEALAQWTKDDGGRPLRDKALRAAGVGYLFVAQDDFRHYWLLVLGG
jgi:uncharacterized protein YkwD